jgi:hypothetical protein
MNYRGKRLFAGRLFAGRLWGPPEVTEGVVLPAWQGSTRQRRLVPKRRRRDTDDDVLLFLLR